MGIPTSDIVVAETGEEATQRLDVSIQSGGFTCQSIQTNHAGIIGMRRGDFFQIVGILEATGVVVG